MTRFLLAAVMGVAVLAAAPANAASSASAPACAAGKVSLTFDDGPSSTVTPRLVRVLKDLHVPATFFMVGERVAAAPATARLVARSGFLIANHSYRHTIMTRQTSEQIRLTLRATDRRLRAAGTTPTRLMRPPYGAINDRIRRAIHDVGMVPVLWDVDPRDWERVSSGTIAARILAGLRPDRRNIVLQHDGIGNSPASIGAVPRVVREARRRGYCFVALDEQGQPGFPVPRADLRVAAAAEGGTARATVRLDRPTARATQVRLRTYPGTAREGADYAGRDVVVRFPAGRMSQTVSIPVREDGLDEATERFRVELSAPRKLTLGRASRVVPIEDRDPPPGVRALDLSVVEPTAGSITAAVRVRLGAPSGRVVRLDVVDVPGTATPGADGDYGHVELRVTIPAGARTAVVPVPVHPDALDEPDETFRLRVLTAVHARVVKRDATVTITRPAA